ncbi:DUF4097 family beta strand repeat-containing protein [Kitasatospora sp. NPDC058170]|uniref:DUF4097 family beta strand repeat-containing protein n=1 Tax=Kitasatospora sp. NPDC058170 TaxID=3346364 RepID=UPI0036DA3E1F
MLPAQHPFDRSWQQDASGRTLLTVKTVGIGVTLSQGDTQEVRITASGDYSGSAPEVSVAASGDHLTVTSGCPGDCSVQLEIVVPAGLASQVDTGDAAIVAGGITGALDLRTTHGAVEVKKSSGPLRVQSKDGAVTISDSTSSDANVATSNGAVDAAFTAAPAKVNLRTRSGAVDLRVPHDSDYYIEARSASSSPEVRLPTDRNASHSLVVETDSGGIRVR